jgi:hypothetical protein
MLITGKEIKRSIPSISAKHIKIKSLVTILKSSFISAIPSQLYTTTRSQLNFSFTNGDVVSIMSM